jgi:hypothetical protein
MNILLTAPNSQEPLAQTAPRGSAGAVSPVQALRAVGEGSSQAPRRQVSPAEQEDAIARLNRSAEPDQGLSLRGRRAVAAYNALDQADEQAYMRQVLGFDASI